MEDNTVLGGIFHVRASLYLTFATLSKDTMEEVEFILFYKVTEAKVRDNATTGRCGLGDRLSSYRPLVRFMIRTNIRLVFLPEML